MTVTTLKKGLRRVIRLILFSAIIVFLGASGTIFTKTPLVIAQWEIASPDNNHIGDVIKATLRIITQPGATVDISKLPDVSDTLPLPPKADNTSTAYPHYDTPPPIPEGELEVVSRRITQHSEDGLVITEIEYEFLYLLPLDLSAPSDDKRLPWDIPLFQEYQQFFTSTGRTERESDKIFVEMANFYIVPRVDKNSQPIFVLFKLTPPATRWPYVRLAGFASFGLAICLLAWRGVGFVATAHRRRQDQIALDPPDANELYQIWCQNPDQAIFVEALKLYRRGIWGRPQTSTWIMTTFILYSGVPLNLDQMKTIFARLVKEVVDEPSS